MHITEIKSHFYCALAFPAFYVLSLSAFYVLSIPADSIRQPCAANFALL